MEVIYEGPVCITCAGKLYHIIVLGNNQWKRCVECKRLTPVKDTDNLQPIEEQP